MIFSEFGKPQVFRSDNGPCYLSQEFRFFMQNWAIKHRTSSPHYPQSNGLAESMVKVSKNLIEKAVLQDLPWNQLLLDYWCTPISSEIPSPAEYSIWKKASIQHFNSTRDVLFTIEMDHSLYQPMCHIFCSAPGGRKTQLQISN